MTCPNCDRPYATVADYDTYAGGEGEHLCWGSGCVPHDWRAEALQLRSQLADTRAVTGALASTFEAAIHAHESRGAGGQHAQYHGDFANITPSVAANMRWWLRRLRGER